MNKLQLLISDAGTRYGNKDFLYEKIDGKFKEISYFDFVNKSNKLSSYLVDEGYSYQNIIVIGRNSINLLVADVAVTENVGICVNVNANTKRDELKEIIALYEAALVICTDEQVSKLSDLDIKVLNIDKELENIVKKYETKTNRCVVKTNKECSKIIFSSGTSSDPKGIMLSINNMLYGFQPLQLRTRFYFNDRIYLVLPLHHTYANLYNFYYAFYTGLSIYLSSGMQDMIEDFQVVKPTIFCGVPLIFERLAASTNDLKGLFGGQIRFIYSGGAKIDLDIKRRYKESGVPILEAYALTETASSFAIEYPDREISDCVGTIFEELDVKILNKDKDGVGKILVKGDCVFLGYYNNRVANKRVFTEDGYFITGDLGYIKKDGEYRDLYIVGRDKKVLLTNNGENIYVDEIVKKIKDMNNKIEDIQLYIKENRLMARIYSEELNEEELKDIVNSYNEQALKHNKISGFEQFFKKNEKLMA